MEFLLILIIAISLSMDAFSLSIAYGTLNLPKKQIYLLGIIVGIFHFFMPLLGLVIGNTILNILKINPDFVVFAILTIIGLDMIYESIKKTNEIKIMKTIELFLFAFAVSIDSFSVGITLNSLNNNYLLSAFIFALTSAFFTFLGLIFGSKIQSKIGTLATIIGGITLIIIGILYYF